MYQNSSASLLHVKRKERKKESKRCLEFLFFSTCKVPHDCTVCGLNIVILLLQIHATILNVIFFCEFKSCYKGVIPRICKSVIFRQLYCVRNKQIFLKLQCEQSILCVYKVPVYYFFQRGPFNELEVSIYDICIWFNFAKLL